MFGRHGPSGTSQALVAYALIVTGIVFGVATISNDNLQDLKTGQLVGATPWRQQVALIIGVVFGALVVPPVLELLNQAFGFAGMPGAGTQRAGRAAGGSDLRARPGRARRRPQLDDDRLGRRGRHRASSSSTRCMGRLKLLRLPPLGVGIGIYLPMRRDPADRARLGDRPVLRPLGRGARRRREFALRMGVLTATGLIVGESLWGVAFAGLVAAFAADAPIALVGSGFLHPRFDRRHPALPRPDLVPLPPHHARVA